MRAAELMSHTVGEAVDLVVDGVPVVHGHPGERRPDPDGPVLFPAAPPEGEQAIQVGAGGPHVLGDAGLARPVVSSKWTTTARVINVLMLFTTSATDAAAVASILCTNPAETPAPARSAINRTHRCTGTCCTMSR